jgi:hypothetical protein
MASDTPFIIDPIEFKYNFAVWAQAWEEVFPGRLIVRKFPPNGQTDIIKDFSFVLENYLGVKVPWASMKMNQSLSSEGMKVLLDYRQAIYPHTRNLTPDVIRLINFLSLSEKKIPQTKPALKFQIAELIRTNHIDDANFIRAKYKVDLGLHDSHSQQFTLPANKIYSVSDIVEFVDKDINERLLIQIAHLELIRPRPFILRIALTAYRHIPKKFKALRLETWLRRLL